MRLTVYCLYSCLDTLMNVVEATGTCWWIVIYDKHSYNKSQRDALFLNLILVKNSTCFGQTYCPSSGVLILYTHQLVFVILLVVMCLSASEFRMELTSLADSQHN